jgi:hypothetical protein
MRQGCSGKAETAGGALSHPSYEMCSRLASMEKGGSPRLLAGTGMPCCSAYSISFVRDVRSHSRHGEMTLMSGFRA